MSRPRTITHAYRMPGGWEKVSRHPLTSDHAESLRGEGYTLVRARRGWADTREISLSLFLVTNGQGGRPAQR